MLVKGCEQDIKIRNQMMVRWKKETDADLDRNPAQSFVTAFALRQGGDGKDAIQVAKIEEVEDIAEGTNEDTAKGKEVYNGQGVECNQSYTQMDISEDKRDYFVDRQKRREEVALLLGVQWDTQWSEGCQSK